MGQVLLLTRERADVGSREDERSGVISARAFDLVVLFVLSPLIAVTMALIALAIYIDSPGPVIFRSQRVGRHGELFEILKFRKMRHGATGHALTLANDERFTPIGRFLAATRLDELPQVWNVMRGDMRLVGPRPELACFVAAFADEYSSILEAPPGLTGVAQLQFLSEHELLGSEDPATAYERHVLPRKLRIDLDYVATRSLLLDARVVLKTIAMPVRVLAARVLRGHALLQRWLPTAGAGALVLALFALSAGNVV